MINFIIFVYNVHTIVAIVTWARHNFEGVVSWCPLFGVYFALKSYVGSESLVRCPESRSVRLSEAT